MMKGQVSRFARLPLNLKLLALLYAVIKTPQFFDELFYRIILLHVVFAFFILYFHLQSPLIVIW